MCFLKTYILKEVKSHFQNLNLKSVLDNIIKFSVNNKFIIGLMTLLLIIWGVWSATKIPIDAQPDITNNQVQIFTLTPTLATQEVEQLVTFPIEQSLVNLPKVEEIRSTSRFGLSVVTIIFKDEVDIYFARQLVTQQLKEAEEQIPPGVGTPELAPVSTGLGEVYQYILHPKPGSEDKYSAMDLRTMQDWIVARQLYGTPGVAEVNGFGGLLKQYEVAIDPNKLKSMGVSIPEIFNALSDNNENTGGAYIDKQPNAYFIRGVGLVHDLEDIKNILVKQIGNVPILIKDVAEVQIGHATRYGALTYNGEVDAVGGIVMMLKGENSAEVVKRIKEKLPVIQESLPDDIIIEPYLDRTDLVSRAMSTVQKNLIEGALIVIFILILFLGNIRAGLILASVIPLSMLFALGMMNLFGVSANLMSLGAIDFGLVVDGSLIVVEATMHHLGLRKSKHKLTQKQMDHEVFESARKVRVSAAFGELIILIVYIPILTLVGIEGKMFTPMAQTVVFAILGALILSFTYIPMMSALCLSKKPSTGPNFSDKLVRYLQKVYQPLLRRALDAKYTVITLAVSLFAISVFIFSKMGGEFLPKLGEGDFAFHCILPQGTSLSQSLETSMQASKIIKEFDEVKMVVGKTGAAEVPTDPMPLEATDLMIILKPQKEWKEKKTYDQLSNEIMEKLSHIPGVFFEANQPIQMRFNELMTGIRQDVAVKIFGEDMDTLLNYAEKVTEIIQKIPGAVAPQMERIAGLPQINIEYDRQRLANYGLSVKEVNDIVSTAFAGKTTGVVFENERKFDLVVRLNKSYRTSIEDVHQLYIPLKTGDQIPLSQVADVDYKLGPAQISREDGKRRIYVGFNVKDRDVASVVEEIQQQLSAQIDLPTGYYFTYGGQFENLEKASKRLLVAVPIALLMIFILLYFTFRSIKEAILVYTAIPMSAIGGIFALLIRGMPFSISAGVGFIALFGVAVLNGIVLIATFNRLEKEGWNEIIPRILEGAKTRLRPVLMTASVASLGFLPMALSTSAGAEVQKPLATVVIGGLISATALTLFVLPLLYFVFMKPRKKKHNLSSVLPLFFIGLVSLMPLSTHAQSKIISLEQAVEQAKMRHPAIRSQGLAIESATWKSKSAFELPKTELIMEWGNTEGFEYNDGFQLSQKIPFPTVWSTKKNLYRHYLNSQEWEKSLLVLEVTQEVRNSYFEVQYFQGVQSVFTQLDSVYADFVRVAEIRYESGDIGLLDVKTAQAKRDEIAIKAQQNEILYDQALNHLKLLIQEEETFMVEDGWEQTSRNIIELLEYSNLNQHPSIKGLEVQGDIAALNRKLFIAESLPEFTFGYNNISAVGWHNYQGQDRFYNRNQRFSYFQLGLGIPLNIRSARNNAKALEKQQEAIELKVEWERARLNMDVKNAQQKYEMLLAQLNHFNAIALPNAEEIIRAAKLGYSTGAISYVEYLFALQTSVEVQFNYLQTLKEMKLAVAYLFSLTNQ